MGHYFSTSNCVLYCQSWYGPRQCIAFACCYSTNQDMKVLFEIGLRWPPTNAMVPDPSKSREQEEGRERGWVVAWKTLYLNTASGGALNTSHMSSAEAPGPYNAVDSGGAGDDGLIGAWSTPCPVFPTITKAPYTWGTCAPFAQQKVKL